MCRTASLVVTTIFDLEVIDIYFENFRNFGHLEQVQVFVIPDKKTPPAAYGRCQNLKKQGLKVVCPTIEEQETFLSRVGFAPHLVPYNSDNRRNIGYLMALEAGTDFVISIDDDNYCCSDEDFFSAHARVCDGQTEAKIVNNTDTGWYNICDMMELDREGATYARGFPYYARHKSEKIEHCVGKATIHINAGLWLLDPDVDAISWLVNPAHTVKFKGESIILGEKVWSPLNTQNTGLLRESIAAYYFIKMGYPLAGIPIDRYGDIFSGYFVQACARHLGAGVRFGTPVAEHKRNTHNYVKDAANEWACIMVLEDLLPWLTEQAELSGDSYPDAYISLSYQIEDIVEHFNGRIWSDAARAYFHQMAYHMRLWAKTCQKLL